MRNALFTLALTLLLVTPATAQWTSGRPDGHAPIGVMLDHVHEAGEFMLSYRYMYMRMDGMRDGTDEIEIDDVVDPNGYGFMVSPTDMSMQMHMFGLMFAPSDRLTLVGMLPLKVLSMDHLARNAAAFTTESSGLGDFSLAGMWLLDPVGDQRAHVSFVASFPTGSIDEEGVTPMSAGQDVQLPYAMQISSGTVDLTPGLTLLGQLGDWSWGGQALATFRMGENDAGYRLGHRYTTTGWGARRFNRWLSASLRLQWLETEAIEGADSRLNPMVVPTADPDLQGGSRWSAAFGLNTYVRGGAFKGLRLAGEWLLPVYQDLDGPQLETDWVIVVGAQYAGDTGLLGSG
ncbi:MAG: transporter [Gemmatimonadota bacterium]|nr:MAG: transporter [Gemmatimonadota bacterium]